MARGRCVGTEKSRYSVEIEIQFGPKQKGDVDNFPKCVLDGLVIAGVIHSDAAVDCLTIKKSRTNALGAARTKIIVRLLQDSRNDAFLGRMRRAMKWRNEIRRCKGCRNEFKPRDRGRPTAALVAGRRLTISNS
jgi:hypothetical protein